MKNVKYIQINNFYTAGKINHSEFKFSKLMHHCDFPTRRCLIGYMRSKDHTTSVFLSVRNCILAFELRLVQYWNVTFDTAFACDDIYNSSRLYQPSHTQMIDDHMQEKSLVR